MNTLHLSEKAKEIVLQAPNWNFEGDCNLLLWMEQISKNLETRAKATTESLDNLTKNLSRAQIGLENTQNSLNALQYTQYVEMRCQEDEPNIEPTKITSEHTVDSKQDILKIFLQNNLKMLHSCHDKFNFLEDSDEDEAETGALTENCIYQPRNPYNDRLLPHVYGTKLWKENWHVGLCEEGSQDFSGDEKSDVYSLSSSSSFESESIESRNAENLSQWTSSTSLNNEGYSNKAISIVPQNYPAAPSTLFEVPIPNTRSIPKSSNVLIEKEIIPTNLTGAESFDSLQAPQRKQRIQSKTLNLFDDNDFKSLMSEITDRTQNKHDKRINQEEERSITGRVTTEIPKLDLFATDSSISNVENEIAHVTKKTFLPENDQTFAQKNKPANLFDSLTDEIPSMPSKPVTQQLKVDLFENISNDINYGDENFVPSKKAHEKTMISAKSLFDDDDDGDEDFLKIFGKAQSTTINNSGDKSVTPTIDNKQQKREFSTAKVSSTITPISLFDDDEDDLIFKRFEEQSLPNVAKSKEPLSNETGSIHSDIDFQISAFSKQNIFSDESGKFENDFIFEQSKNKNAEENIEEPHTNPVGIEIETPVVLHIKINDPPKTEGFNENIFNKSLVTESRVISVVKDKTVTRMPTFLDMEPPVDTEEELYNCSSVPDDYNDDKSKSYAKIDLFYGEDFDSQNESVALNLNLESEPKTNVNTPITTSSTYAETLTTNISENTNVFERNSYEQVVENLNDDNSTCTEITESIKEVSKETSNETNYEKNTNAEKHTDKDDQTKETFSSLFDDTPPELENITSISSEDTIDKSSTMKTSGYDNFSPLFLDEPPDDDFFQIVSGNILSTQPNLENDFFESTSETTKMQTESKVEDPAHIPKGYNIGLFSDIPPDDDESHSTAFPISSKSYMIKSDSLTPKDLDVTTAVKSHDNLFNNRSVGTDIKRPRATKEVINQQVKTPTDIPPKATISKLKMPSININVQALLPGAAGKSIKSNTNTTMPVRDEKLLSSEVIESAEKAYVPKETRLNNERENILPSLCKNRVRGPVKRRASTRAGRQESYQRSLENAQKEAEIDEISKIENENKASHNAYNVKTLVPDRMNQNSDYNFDSKQPLKVTQTAQQPNKQTTEIIAVNEDQQYSLPNNQIKVKSKIFHDSDENEDNEDLFSNIIKGVNTKEVHKKPRSLSMENSSMGDHLTKAGLSLNDPKPIEAKRAFPKLPTEIPEFQQEPFSKTIGSNLFADFDEKEGNDDFFINLTLEKKKEKNKNTKTEDHNNQSLSFLTKTASMVDGHTNKENISNSVVAKSSEVFSRNPLSAATAQEGQKHNLEKNQLMNKNELFNDFDESEDNDDFFSNLIKHKTAKPTVERSSITPQQTTPITNKSLNDLFAAEVEEHKKSPNSTTYQGVALIRPSPTKKSSLFSSDTTDDDDDDLFQVKVPPKVLLNNAKTEEKNQSLFTDSEDDDDLFGGGAKKTTKSVSKEHGEFKPTHNVPKNTKPLPERTQSETSKTTDNPLADLLDS